MPLEKTEDRDTTAFFGRVVERFRLPVDLRLVVVTHVLPDRPHFFDALNTYASIAVVIPKPRSKNREMMAELARDGVVVAEVGRNNLAEPGFARDFLAQHVGDRHFAILDIGGYFAPAMPELCKAFPGQLVAVVEDTENGHQRYESALADLQPRPHVFSVARSPLKDTEDFLVGQAVVHSFETLVRRSNQIIQGREAAVIGYGKIGRSVSQHLAARQVRTSVIRDEPR